MKQDKGAAHAGHFHAVQFYKDDASLTSIVAGFLAPDERASYGRPVGVAIGPGGCLLVADDVGDVIWRVTDAP